MLVWAEPFEQYGGTSGFVGNSGYTDLGFNNVSQTPGRTGARCMGANNSGYLRRALDNPATTLGMGWALFPTATAFYNDANGFNNWGGRWDSAGKTVELTVTRLQDLSLAIFDRTNTLVGRTAPNRAFINNWTWIEAKAIKNTGGANTGYVEVRVNGGGGANTVIVNGINLPNTFAYHAIGGFEQNYDLFDDWIVWDGTGPYNNDFMGDRRLDFEMPNANSALQDFTASSGFAWDCINNVPPVDTTYIEGAAAGNISEFQKTGIAINSNDIAAVVVGGRMFKTDAGVASGRVGLTSAGNTLNSAELFPGTSGQYFYFPIERDPNGTIAWTRANADAALIRATRVS